MKTDLLRQTITEAERERTTLQTRLDRLTGIIDHARALLMPNGVRPAVSAETSGPALSPSVPKRRKPPAGQGIWTTIREVVAASPRPMTLAEIAAGCAKAGLRFPDKGDSRVRWAMKHRPETFRRVGRGKYALRTAPTGPGAAKKKA